MLPDLLRVVVITDWHTNPQYNASLGASCRCTLWPGEAPQPGCALAPPGSVYGQFGCDSSPALANSSLSAAALAAPAPDLVLVLGDLVTHDSPANSFTQATFHEMSRQISDAFPSRPYACQTPLGNNDVFPNYGINNSDPNFYAEQAATARQYCGATEAEANAFAATGYYSRQLRELDRLLVLNTNIYASQNAVQRTNAKLGYYARRGIQPADRFTARAALASRSGSGGGGSGGGGSSARPLTPIDPDPLGQFAWMRQHLEWASASGGRIYIAGHIPPTLDSYARVQQWQQPYADQYWALLAEFPTVVGFHLFGHLHSAEVRVQRSADPAVQAAPALQILASVSPIYATNPSFYTLTLDASMRQSNLTMHSFALDELVPGGAPVYAPRPPRPLDQTGGFTASNRDYLDLFDAFLRPELNASTSAQFDAFFNQYKGGYHGEGLACEHASATFQECATCAAGCRVAFACLQAHGTREVDYLACVEEHAAGESPFRVRVEKPGLAWHALAWLALAWPWLGTVWL